MLRDNGYLCPEPELPLDWFNRAPLWPTFLNKELKLTLTTAIGLVKNYLMSIMSVISTAQNLILSLYLLIVGKLSWIVHVDFSSFIKIHIPRWVKHRTSSLSCFSISLQTIKLLKSLTLVDPIVPPSWLLCNFDWIWFASYDLFKLLGCCWYAKADCAPFPLIAKF